MPPNSKKGKKKSKSKQHSKKGSSSAMQAKLYHDTEEYPSSRVIKRAPNGDVIVESLANDEESDEVNTGTGPVEPPMAFTLDSHWESLNPEEKKSILRIEKGEVFDIIRNYQNSHNCNCSVCGRRHMAMDQEMERIYNTLYDIDRERDPEINPVKFHLSIIKELQTSKAKQQQDDLPLSADGTVRQDADESDNVKDDVVKYFLSSNAVDSLKEEVMHFKQNKQQQQQQQQVHPVHDEVVTGCEGSTSAEEHAEGPSAVRSPSDDEDYIDENFKEASQPEESQVDNEGLQAKYLKFAKTFVSSHPKIAQEYVSRMMRYPDMRALTDDLMNNNGQGFVKAIENFVAQKQKPPSKESVDTSANLPASLSNPADTSNTNLRNLGGAKEFTTMLHNGQPLTAEEYANLQRHVADRMTNSYDAQKKEFKEVSQLERELFTRFMFGEDRKRFGDMIMQSFREKFDDQYSTAAIGASLAAAAVTTISPIEMPGHDEISEDYDIDLADDEIDKVEYHDNELDESYDEFSDYEGDEDEEDDIGADEDLRSHLNEEEEDIVSETDADHQYSHATGVPVNHECYEQKDEIQSDTQGHHQGHYHSHHDHDDENDDENDKYESSLDEADRLEEGRKLIQIAITKLLQGRIMESYHEKQAENNRLKLLQELEAEEEKKKAKEEKKLKKREKEKEKKKAQQLAKEEERRRKEEEAELMKREAEERETQRREAQRQKVEEAKRKKDEERRRKLEEQRRREEEQERHRKLKEEQKRKREEEKRLKDEEKKRREEEKRQKEEFRAQKLSEQNEEQSRARELNKLTDRGNTQGSYLEQPLKSAEQNPSSFTPLQYSSLSPNIPYGNTDIMPPSHKSSINDDILNMVSSATASKPGPDSAGMHKLLEIGNSSSPDATQMISNNVPMFSSNFLQPNAGPGDGLSFNNMPCMLPPASSSQNSVSTGIGGQNFGLSSWNSFGSNSSLLKSFQTTSLDIPREQCQHSASSFGPNNTQPANEEYLAKEMNNIASMLSSAGLEDSTSTARGDLFGQDAVWGPRRDVSNNMATGIAHGHVNEMHLDPNHTSVRAPTSDIPVMKNAQQHSSIWDNGSEGLIPSNGTKNTNLPSSVSTNSNKFSTSIWGNSIPPSVSFMAESNDHPNLAMPNVKAENEINNNGPNGDDTAFMDSIYRAYLASCPPSSRDFVPTKLIHQNGLCRTMSYPSFISCLVRMHHAYGCEVLTDALGSITHARMAGSPSELKDNQSRKPSRDVLNDGFFSETSEPILSSLNDHPTSTAAENVPNFGHQFFGVTQPTTHSSLAGNIWG